MSNAWGSATEILESYGVEEDPGYYREFTGADEKAVMSVSQRVQDAWLKNDADAFADTFAENGSLLLMDTQMLGREEIRAFMRAGFDGGLKGASVRGWPLEITFLDEDVAVMVTEGGLIRPGESEIAPENQIRAVWVIHRNAQGRLSLVSHQSSPLKG